MANTLNLGSGNWGVKDSSLLGYKNRQNGRFIPETFDVARASAGTRVNQSGLIETPEEILSADLVTNGDFSQEGVEQVTNGDFATDTSWSKNPTVTISGGSANFTGTSGAYLSQNCLTNGTRYHLTFDVSAYTSGFLTIFGGANSSISSGTINSVGSYSFYFTAGGLDTKLYFGSGFTGSIDNVSVKEVGQDWTLGTGWSIGSGTANCDGTNAVAIEQNLSTVNTVVKKITFTVSNYVSGQLRVYSGAGADILYTVTANGTYTYYDYLVNNKIFFYSISSFIGSVDNVSVVEVNRDNLARIDYLDDAAGVLLTEPQSTNLITDSNDFTQWVNTRSSDLGGFISPTGETNGTKFISDNTASSTHILKSSTFTISSGQKHTYSVFLKANQLNFGLLMLTDSTVTNYISTYFDLLNGTIGQSVASGAATFDSANIENFGNGWYRCSVSGDLSTTTTASTRIYLADSNNSAVVDGDGIKSIYTFGVQVEELSYATSYIPTEGVAATRLADVVNNAGDVNNFNSEEGVLFVEASTLGNDVSRIITIKEKISSQDRMFLRFDANGTITYRYYVGASIVINMVYSGINPLENNKIACKWELNNFSLWVNGVKVDQDLSGAVKTPNTFNSLSLDEYSTINSFYGKTKNIQVFDALLSDAELITLTTI